MEQKGRPKNTAHSGRDHPIKDESGTQAVYERLGLTFDFLSSVDLEIEAAKKNIELHPPRAKVVIQAPRLTNTRQEQDRHQELLDIETQVMNMTTPECTFDMQDVYIHVAETKDLIKRWEKDLNVKKSLGKARMNRPSQDIHIDCTPQQHGPRLRLELEPQASILDMLGPSPKVIKGICRSHTDKVKASSPTQELIPVPPSRARYVALLAAIIPVADPDDPFQVRISEAVQRTLGSQED